MGKMSYCNSHNGNIQANFSLILTPHNVLGRVSKRYIPVCINYVGPIPYLYIQTCSQNSTGCTVYRFSSNLPFGTGNIQVKSGSSVSGVLNTSGRCGGGEGAPYIFGF